MSCAKVALDMAGIPVAKYFSSELDRDAIEVSESNWGGQIIRLGDIREMIPIRADLVMAGSPCQSLSNLGNRTGFKGKSGIFYDFVKKLEFAKPTYFLYENVRMKQEWEDEISSCLGVQPVTINSNMLSAQNRVRKYWTNIPFEPPTVQSSQVFGDVLDLRDWRRHIVRGKERDYALNLKGKFKAPVINSVGQKSHTLIAKMYISWQGPYVYVNPDTGIPTSDLENFTIRRLTPLECERLQTMPDNYTLVVPNRSRYRMLGNGWTVSVISHILKGIA